VSTAQVLNNSHESNWWTDCRLVICPAHSLPPPPRVQSFETNTTRHDTTKDPSRVTGFSRQETQAICYVLDQLLLFVLTNELRVQTAATGALSPNCRYANAFGGGVSSLGVALSEDKRTSWPPLWSTGQSSWLQIQRSGFHSRCCQAFWEVAGLERSPLSLVSTIEELLDEKVDRSDLENREYGRRGTTRHPLSAKIGTNFTDKRPSLGWSPPGFSNDSLLAVEEVLCWYCGYSCVSAPCGGC
jgi:hypothetical protein